MSEQDEGSIEWWRAEVERRPLRDDDVCDVRGDVLRELLRGYVPRDREET